MIEITTHIKAIMERVGRNDGKIVISQTDYMDLLSMANAWVADWESKHDRNYKDFNEKRENEK